MSGEVEGGTPNRLAYSQRGRSEFVARGVPVSTEADPEVECQGVRYSDPVDSRRLVNG